MCAVWRIEMKMKNSNTKFVGRWWVLTAVVFGGGLLNASRSYSQEAKTLLRQRLLPSPMLRRSRQRRKRDQGRREECDSNGGEASGKSRRPGHEGDGERRHPVPPLLRLRPRRSDAAPRTTAAAHRKRKRLRKKPQCRPVRRSPRLQPKLSRISDSKSKQSLAGVRGCLDHVILALFVLPIMAGNYLAKIWRMPDHAWKMSLVIGDVCRIDPHLFVRRDSNLVPTWPAASR